MEASPQPIGAGFLLRCILFDSAMAEGARYARALLIIYDGDSSLRFTIRVAQLSPKHRGHEHLQGIASRSCIGLEHLAIFQYAVEPFAGVEYPH